MDLKENEKHCLTKEITKELNNYFDELFTKISKYNRVVIGEFNTAMFDNGIFNDTDKDNAGAKISSYCYGMTKGDCIVTIGNSNVMGDSNRYIYLGYNGLCYVFESVFFKWETFKDDNGDIHAMYGFFYEDTPLYCFFIEGDSYVPYCAETIEAARHFLFSEEC